MDVMPEEKRKAIPALGFYPQEQISTGVGFYFIFIFHLHFS